MSKNNDIGRGNTVSLLHFSQRAHERFPDLIDYYRQLPSSGYSIYQLTDVLTMNDKNINNVKLSDLTIPAKDYYWPWMHVPTADGKGKMVKLKNSRDDLESRQAEAPVPDDRKNEQVVVMQLELDDCFVLFFSKSEKYSKETLDSKYPGSYYHYNSGTCPMNWLQSLSKVITVDKETGVIDDDPHGLFRLVGVIGTDELSMSMAYQGTPSKLTPTDEFDYTALTKDLNQDKSKINLLQTLMNSQNPGDQQIAIIQRLFIDLINSTRSLFQLINACNNQDLLLNVTVSESGYTLISGSRAFNFDSKDKEELSFIESVGEFIGGGCIY